MLLYLRTLYQRSLGHQNARGIIQVAILIWPAGYPAILALFYIIKCWHVANIYNCICFVYFFVEIYFDKAKEQTKMIKNEVISIQSNHF